MSHNEHPQPPRTWATVIEHLEREHKREPLMVDIAASDAPDSFDVWFRHPNGTAPEYVDESAIGAAQVFELLGSLDSRYTVHIALIWTSAHVTLDMALDLFQPS